MTLAWFAARSGNPAYYERDRFLSDPESQGELTRFAGAGLVWLSQFETRKPTRSQKPGRERAPTLW